MIKLDVKRLQAIRDSAGGYYSQRSLAIRKDNRLGLLPGDFLAQYFQPGMRVLDVGCGSGENLLEYHARFQIGVGIDADPEHLKLAELSKLARKVTNVSFARLRFPEETAGLEQDMFDVVFSNRGPLGDSPANLQAGLRLLKPDGLILVEEIGELHQPEVKELFGEPVHGHQTIRVGEELRMDLAACGVAIRLCADSLSNWIYPSVYEWFAFQCSIWTWQGRPLPAADDPRIALFAERNTIASGEILTTHHVAVVAGVKPGR